MPISVRGSRENNLQSVDLDIPLGSLVVFTGPSGSGKTSLASDTLHAEGQRRYLEALSANVRKVAGKLRRPDVDVVLGLPPTIALEQRGGSPQIRSTVGSLVEAWPVLRVLYARAGVQHCPTCDSVVSSTTHDEIVARIAARPADTRLTLEAPVRRRPGEGGARVLDEIARSGFSRVRLDGEILRLEDVDPKRADAARTIRVVVDRLRIEPDRTDRVHDAVRTTSKAGQGVVVAVVDGPEGPIEDVFTERPYCFTCDRELPPLEPALLSWNAAGACPTCRGRGTTSEDDDTACPACRGDRLSPEARAVRWRGLSLPELGRKPSADVLALLRDVAPTPVEALPIGELVRSIGALTSLGLGYLALMRGSTTLSSGELQRLRLARQVGAGLSGVLYVLDEPTAGLAPEDVRAVVDLVRKLRDLGNTVICVEHHPALVRAADLVVDFGPGAGTAGGRVVYAGDLDGLLAADTATGLWLSGRRRLPVRPPRPPEAVLQVRGASAANLKSVDVDLPIGRLVAIEGSSGSGKTALLDTIRTHLEHRLNGGDVRLAPVKQLLGLEAFQRLVEVDRASVGRSPRSNPATYTGLWDVMRELLAATREAKVRGLEAAFFSLNQKGGRCEACQGTGFRRVDLGVLPDVFLPCDVCGGRRFTADVLEVTWKGLSADQILDLTVDEARPLLAGHPRMDAVLRALGDVGLGYLALGQPAHTLSGGESQRLRLARELTRASRAGGEGTLYLVDDPTVGLHPADVDVLLHLFRRLVDEGATVWLATSHAPLASRCDHVVRLGPGGGPEGGRVVSVGQPASPGDGATGDNLWIIQRA